MTLAQRLSRAGIAVAAIGTIASQVPPTGGSAMADSTYSGPEGVCKVTVNSANPASQPVVDPFPTPPASWNPDGTANFRAWFKPSTGTTFTLQNARWEILGNEMYFRENQNTSLNSDIATVVARPGTATLTTRVDRPEGAYLMTVRLSY